MPFPSAQEVRIIACLKLNVRLEVLSIAVIRYQQILLAQRHCEEFYEQADEAYEEAIRLAEYLPSELSILSLATTNRRQCQDKLTQARVALDRAAVDFIEATAPITQLIMQLLEEHEYKLDTNKLMAVLADEADKAAAIGI